MTAVKQDIVDIVISKGFQYKNVKQAVSVVLEGLQVLISQLSPGDRLELRGFGSFICKKPAKTICYNPNTGECVPVVANRKIVFKPGQALKAECRK